MSNVERLQFDLDDFDQNMELRNRVRLITRLNPFMAQNPDAVYRMAALPISTSTLGDSALTLYGITAADRLKGQLESMGEIEQRSVFNRLPLARQQALISQGYQKPEEDSQLLGAIGEVLGVPLKGVGAVVSGLGQATKPVWSPVLEGLSWASDQPARVYRAVRTMDTEAQLAALGGAVIGVAGAVLAIPTGGASIAGSLAALTTLGLAGTAGAAAGATVADHRDFGKAFIDAGEGERTFDRSSQAQARSLLGDPRLMGVAYELADGSTRNVFDIAREVAGIRQGPDALMQQKRQQELTDIADSIAQPNTPQHRQALNSLLNLLNEPLFLEAVDVLQKGKISIGRDIADLMQLDPDGGLHKYVSGSLDGLFVVAVDPTLAAGRFNELIKFRRFGLDAEDGIVNLERFKKLSDNVPSVRNLHEKLAEAVDTNDFELARRLAPGFDQLWDGVRTYRDQMGIAAGEFKREHIVGYITENSNMDTILRGIGTARAKDRLMLRGFNQGNEAWMRLSQSVRSFTSGLTDVRLEQRMIRNMIDSGDAKMLDIIPSHRRPAPFTRADLPMLRTVANLDVGSDGAWRLAEDNLGVANDLAHDLADSLLRKADLDADDIDMLEDLRIRTSIGQFNPVSGNADDVQIGNRVRDLAAAYQTLDIGDIVERISDDLGRIAIESDRLPQVRRLGRAVAEYLPRTSYSVGSIAQMMTTMIPPQGAIRFVGKEAPEEIRRATELMRLTYMPEYMRRMWFQDIMSSSSGNLRAVGLMSMFDNALSVAGVRELKGGEAMIDEFLTGVNKAYAFGGADEVALKSGRKVRVSALLDDSADFLTLPDLTTIRKNVKATHFARVMGILDFGVVDSFINRVWKPAVLLRLAFIPRAAGEEWINFTLRAGYGSMVQNYGAQYVGRYKAWEQVIEKIKRNELTPSEIRVTTDGRGLTRDEFRLFQQGPLPMGLRRIERSLQNIGWGEPVINKMMEVNNMFREFLTPQALGGQGGLGFGARLGDAIDNLGGSARASLIAGASESTVRRGIGLSSTERMRLNVSQYADSILLGNPLSWRRMIAGGIDDTAIRAAERYQLQFYTTMMREASAVEAGHYDRGYKRDDVFQKTVIEDGKERTSMYLAERGGYKRQDVNVDLAARKAGHSGALRPVLEDEGGGRVAVEVYLRLLPQGVSMTDAERFVAQIDEAVAVTNDAALDVVRSLSRNHSRDVFDTTIQAHQSQNQILSVVAAQMPTYGNVTIDEFREAARVTLNNIALARAGNKQAAEALQKAFDAAKIDRVFIADRDEALLEMFFAPQVEAVLATVDRGYRRSNAIGEWFDVTIDGRRTVPELYDARSGQTNMSFYRSIDEFEDDAVEVLRSHFAAAFNQDQTSMNRFLGDQPGLAQNDTVVLWTVDDAVDSVESIAPSVYSQLAQDAFEVTADDLVKGIVDKLIVNADNPQVLVAKRGVLEQWVTRHMENAAIRGVTFGGLRLDGTQQGVLFEATERVRRAQRQAARQGVTAPSLPPLKFTFADRQVVDQLNRSLHRTLGSTLNLPVPSKVDVYGIRINRSVLDDRTTPVAGIEGSQNIQVVPREADAQALAMPMAWDPTADGRVELWSIPRQFTIQRAQLVTDLEPVDKATELAQAQLQLMKGRLSTQQRETYRARTRRTITQNADGTITEGEIARVYRYRADGTPEPVPVGETLLPDVQYYNEKMKPIDVRDGRYAEPIDVQLGGDFMWSMLAPAIGDLLDRRRGLLRMRRKNEVVSVRGKMEASPDWIPVYRSHESQMPAPSDGGPTTVIGPAFREIKENLWDRIVRVGFDRVIGPAIDAIVRKPMAFHFFHQRYRMAENNYKAWLVDRDLADRTFNELSRVGSRFGNQPYSPSEFDRNIDTIKRLLDEDGMVGAREWTGTATAAWIRGHEPEQLETALDAAISRVASRALDPNLTDEAAQALERLLFDGSLLRRTGGKKIVDGVGTGNTLDEKIARLRANLPETAFNNPKAFSYAMRKNLETYVEPEAAEVVVAYVKNLRHAEEAAGKYAMEAALRDIMPFVDSQEVRTQFAEYGKNLLPFWYAEENFLKRWARTVIDDPTVIRKAQLTYQGLRTVGIIRTDENGRDWFVYPGSSLLLEAMQKAMPGAPIAAIGTMFQSPTDMMFPGLSERFGQPGVSPWISVPVETLSALMPELQPLERAVLGDVGASRDWYEHIVPSTITNVWQAATGDEESSQRFLSAFNAALAHRDATGQGLPANADFQQRDDYLRDVREHTRIIVLSQALAGFVTPGPAMPLYAGETESFFGLGAVSPGDVLNDQYLQLVRELGIEQGTVKYLELFPQSTFKEIFRPEAFTVGRTESVSGAPMPTTQDALDFYNDNREYMDVMNLAGAWLMPSPPRDPEMKSQYVFDQQVVNEMRRQRTPDEFLDELKFREASPMYFRTNRFYDEQIDRAKAQNNEALAAQLRDQKSSWSQMWRAAHPVFERMLSSTDNAVRRQQTIAQMRTIVGDPSAPPSPKLPAMRNLMREYDRYQGLLAQYREDGTYGGKASLEQLKLNWSQFLDYFVGQNPELQAFAISVVRPESSLD